MEAVITVRNHGFQRILILTNSKDLIQLVSKSKKPAWQESSLVADLDVLYQNGLFFKLLKVPRIVLDLTCDRMVSNFLEHQTRTVSKGKGWPIGYRDKEFEERTSDGTFTAPKSLISQGGHAQKSIVCFFFPFPTYAINQEFSLLFINYLFIYFCMGKLNYLIVNNTYMLGFQRT